MLIKLRIIFSNLFFTHNIIRFLLRKPSRSPPAGGGHGLSDQKSERSEAESERKFLAGKFDSVF